MEEQLRESFICSVKEETEGNVHVFLQNFDVNKKLSRAVLQASALGVYEIEVNGKKVGDMMFAPGYTYYPYRLLFQEYDVTDLLSQEENELKAYLGQGWYCGRFTCADRYQIYGEIPAIAWNLRLEYEDGSTQTVASDEKVQEIPSPYAFASLYNGEEIYADGQPGEACPVKRFEGNIPEKLEKTQIGVKLQEEMPIQAVTTRGDKTILDCGQNFAGVICIHPRNLKGETLVVRHGEILTPEGDLYTENLRKARATIIYHSGEDKQDYLPRFTYMGFRYVELSGAPYTEGLITAHVLHSQMTRTGYFTCENELADKLYRNQIWGQRSNYVAVPTDCPQRDERQGYTGDGHVFARTGSYNYDTRSFWRQYLADLAEGQRDNSEGYVGATVPAEGPAGIEKITMLGWGNAVTILPDLMYEQYGDVSFIENQYESMKLFVEAEIRHMNRQGLWLGMSLGDWLTYHKDMGYLIMHNNPVSNAFVVHDLDLMAKAAHLLGKEDEAQYYAQLAQRSRNGYLKRWVKKNGSVDGDYQGAAVMALAFVIPQGDLRKKALARLASLVRKEGMRTGFFATQHILPLLVEAGETALAYDVLLNEECPGWMYQIKAGATTTWERWDALRPDGTVNESKVGADNMVSFNHYAFGSVGQFYYEHILGIQAVEPGFAKVRIAPVTDPRLGSVSGSYETAHGKISVAWKYHQDRVSYEIEVPVEAVIVLPDGEHAVEAGKYEF